MEESVPAESEGKVLVFAGIGDSSRATSELEAQVPELRITTVETVSEYEAVLAREDFDLVVLDWDIPELQSLEKLAQLKVRDNEPQVLLLSNCHDPKIVRLIAESKKRYVVRDEHWLPGLIIAVKDMFRIKRLEHEMTGIRARLTEANSLLEEKNRRLDEFCMTVAHDIRGPLAGLMLKMEYVLDTYESDFEPRCQDLLRRSLNSAERLTQIVQAMYEFAKIGSSAAKMEPIDLKQLVLEVVGDLPLEEERDVQVGVGELPYVFGNPALLRRVFINLISNAVKYNDKEAPRINVGFTGLLDRTLAPYAQVFIEDNGPGIAERDLERIFSMFTRGTQGSRDGLGVGLAVVERIIELHYGKIDVESAVGMGTRFSMLLPTRRVEIVN